MLRDIGLAWAYAWVLPGKLRVWSNPFADSVCSAVVDAEIRQLVVAARASAARTARAFQNDEQLVAPAASKALYLLHPYQAEGFSAADATRLVQSPFTNWWCLAAARSERGFRTRAYHARGTGSVHRQRADSSVYRSSTPLWPPVPTRTIPHWHRNSHARLSRSSRRPNLPKFRHELRALRWC